MIIIGVKEKKSDFGSSFIVAVVFNSDTLISTVTYPLKADNSRLTEVKISNGENKVLEAIKGNPKVSQPQTAKLTGISQRTVNRIIAELRESGRIVRVGKTKGSYWDVK